MAMRPCPNCAWMLKETDSACSMCGAAVPGAAPPPPAQGGAGAYAPPGPPGYASGGVAPPPPVTGYGGMPPAASPGGYPSAMGAHPPGRGAGLGGASQPPPAGGAAFSSAVNEPFTTSPWAREAPVAAAQQPQPLPNIALGAPTPAGTPQLAAPITGLAGTPMVQAPPVPGAPSMGAPATPMFGAPPPVPGPMSPPGVVAPPPMVTGGVVGGPAVQRPPPLGAVSPPGGMAPPPVVSPGGMAPPPVMTPGSVAPPPVVSPPGMMQQPGMVSPPPLVAGSGAPALVGGGMAAPGLGAGVSSSRVLVGFLVTFQNDPGGSFWPLYSGRTQMGRATNDGGPDIALPDASASSRHASIHADSATGQAFIEDDGSRNGTFLNEQRLPQGERRQLRDNDRLRLGSTTFVVKLLVS